MRVLAITSAPEAVRAIGEEPGVTELVTETSLAAGLARVRERRWALVLLDSSVDGSAGGELLARVAALQPRVVALERSCTLTAMIAALRRGAVDVLPLPPTPQALRDVLAGCRALAAAELSSCHAHAPRESPFIADSANMLHVLKMIARVAPTAATVVLRGESGTGKECVARLIHQHSERAAGPFVAVNCAAIPESLLETELFGCERGAFTGAVARRVGRFERASGGTLFLDEIGDMPLALQAKILRALQEREVERVGGDAPVPIDVRLVAATHRDLEEMVRARSFRADLYYRLTVCEMRLPALRERGEDIGALTEYFVAQFAAEHHRAVHAVADETMAILSRHQWPGNVRQLRNVLERAVLAADGPVVMPAHLPAGTLAAAFPVPAAAAVAGGGGDDRVVALDDVVRAHIMRALAATGGHLGNAAERLGIHRNTLRRKLQEYGVAEDGSTMLGGAGSAPGAEAGVPAAADEQRARVPAGGGGVQTTHSLDLSAALRLLPAADMPPAARQGATHA